ncbi:hypothetical protein [Mycobacterium sp. MUNTM1]
MTRLQCFTGSRFEDASFLPATLESVRRCPARSDFIELCFATDEGGWTWCFRDPAERGEGSSDGTLALTVGPYGAQARNVEEGGLGPALPTSEALPIILGGSRVYLARQLVERW